MITVKLYGLLRLDSGIRELQVDAENVKQLYAALLARTERITREDLEGCAILINGAAGSKRSKLKDGDEVVLLSPVTGG